MKTAKSLKTLNNNSNHCKKNKSFHSANSQSKVIRTPQINYTVLNYVQRRLAEINNNNHSNTPQQVTITKNNVKRCIDPPIAIHQDIGNNKQEVRHIQETKPKIIIGQDKNNNLTDLINRYTQRSKSRDNSEVFVLKKENRKLKEEIGVYQSQLNQLERKMNAFINQEHMYMNKDPYRYSNRHDLLMKNDMDNTINSLSVSLTEDDKIHEINSKMKKKGALCPNVNSDKH